jgi:hypothetical protein
MKTTNLLFGLFTVMVAAAPRLTRGAELKPATLQAWNQYVEGADAAMRTRLDPGHQFLWTDESPDRSARLRRGEILVEPMIGPGVRRLPDGLIHHWVGALFIPGATLESVLAVAHDYDHYKEIYRPKVVDSKLLASEDGRQKYSILWLNNVLFVNAALKSEYEAHDFPVDQRRWYNIAHVTNAHQEVDSYGQKDERVLPPGQGNGFIWRLQSIVRYEERDGGVYVELEAIGLTRDIPASLRWLANPLVARLSRSTLATSLRRTREGVAASARELRASASGGTYGFRVKSAATGEDN